MRGQRMWGAAALGCAVVIGAASAEAQSPSIEQLLAQDVRLPLCVAMNPLVGRKETPRQPINKRGPCEAFQDEDGVVVERRI